MLTFFVFLTAGLDFTFLVAGFFSLADVVVVFFLVSTFSSFFSTGFFSSFGGTFFLSLASSSFCCFAAGALGSDGASMAATGIISYVNETARAAGCVQGLTAMECARAMLTAPGQSGSPPSQDEARFVIRDQPDLPLVIGCDSVSLVRPADSDAIVITASHGELLRESPSWGNRPDVLGAVFNDAGSNHPTRLPNLDTRGIAGATVSADSARIGDARSSYEVGVISHINETARALSATPGMTCRAFVDVLSGTPAS